MLVGEVWPLRGMLDGVLWRGEKTNSTASRQTSLPVTSKAKMDCQPAPLAGTSARQNSKALRSSELCQSICAISDGIAAA